MGNPAEETYCYPNNLIVEPTLFLSTHYPTSASLKTMRDANLLSAEQDRHGPPPPHTKCYLRRKFHLRPRCKALSETWTGTHRVIRNMNP